MKKMLFSLLLIAILLPGNYTFADGISSKITEVTVYKQSARITSVAKTSIVAGSSTLVISNLPATIIANSIQVYIDKSVKLLSVSYAINYLKDKENTKEVTVLKDSLDLLNKDLLWIRAQKKVYEGEEALITLNNKLGSEQQGMTVTELTNLANFYRKRMLETKTEWLKLDAQEKKVTEAVARITRQLSGLNANKTVPTGEVTLDLSAAMPVTASIEITYLVTNCGWTPVYDLRSDGTDKPVTFTYKANIFQNTGYSWDNVKLTISSANPTQDNNRPILRPRYVYFYTPPVYGTRTVNAPVMANMALEKKAPATLSDDEGYSLGKMELPVFTATENQLSIDYTVTDPYRIPSDGATHIVIMKEASIKADYLYHAVPILDRSAFLLAKIANWNTLNLLPGTANLFFEGRFIGQSYIDPYVTADTMLVSFGRDERIVIKREKLNDLSNIKYPVGMKKETIAYEITVRNSKSIPITIELLDQIPISQVKEIEVLLEDKGTAEYLSEYGKLSWKLDVKPNETQKVRFIYSVKYPKDKVVTGQ